MNKKCMACGLVNFADTDVCRRCGGALSAPPPSQQAYQPYQPAAVVQEESSAEANRYLRKMIFGLLWAVGGTAVTVLSYNAAASNQRGGSYVIAWGAILFGAIDFFVGLGGWLSSRKG